MTWPATQNPGWADRVTQAGVRIDLWDTDLDDYQFATLAITILCALREASLTDEDLYPLLVRLWLGEPPAIDWPPQAPTIARRCATALASRSTCQLDSFTFGPTDAALNAAREAIIAELRLTRSGLLAVLIEHWEQLAHLEMPFECESTLLIFARNVLLEPVVGACAYIWSTLDSRSSSPDPAETFPWNGWSPVAPVDWRNVVTAELDRLHEPPNRHPPDDGQGVGIDSKRDTDLAAARAAVLQTHNDPSLIAASIVRTSGWPGDTKQILPLARRAVELAQQHLNDLDPADDNDEIIDTILGDLMPSERVLIEWIRDPAFATIIDYAGTASTASGMLREAADDFLWSLARAALDVFVAMRCQPLRTDL